MSRLVLAAALAVLALHLATVHGYGYFRDELYYLACGRHLAAGYVDHPPLVAWVAAAIAHALGTSLPALRLVPALAGAVTVWLAGASTAVLGGRGRAQLTAALAVGLAPIGVAMSSYYSMNALELALWGAAFWLFARILRADKPTTRSWLWLGLVLGIALENKISTLYLGLGLTLGLVAARRDLVTTRGPYLAAAIALTLFVPHVAWQVAHDFPTLEFVRNARATKMAVLPLSAWLGEQLLEQGPLAAPLWLLGLVTLLRASQERPLGLAFVAIVAVLLVGKGKPYYAAAAYLPLFAAGSAAITNRPRLQTLSLSFVCISGLITLPLGKPVLPVASFLRYQAALGVSPQSVAERHAVGVLPQFFADMHGWPELAARVAEVHRSLTPNARAEACVFAQNYGQAGAIDLFGRAYGLPPALSGHNNYWLWGPGRCTGQTLIVLGGDEAALRMRFTEVALAATHECALCMPYESPKPIYVVRGPRVPIAVAWAGLKHFQ